MTGQLLDLGLFLKIHIKSKYFYCIFYILNDNKVGIRAIIASFYMSCFIVRTNGALFCSSFNNHLARSLTKEESDKLKDPKWKFKWEMPENDIALSKWVGTGKPISKVLLSLRML